ncbi:hypothetical protein ACKWTF_011182 [Chironomus riparius]
MVWFHGGGWTEFHSGHSVYGPGYLLDHDIILVTGNYRLGTLGFLSTEDEQCPGNFGFKDQRMMLEWVQENIEKFGGDKDSVTIFGESAGGAIVTLLMNSPKTQNLFHRVIAQSGNMMNVWSEPLRTGLANERATKLADMMDCPCTSTTKEMIECLRKVPANKITAAVRNFMIWDCDPVIPFGAVVENCGPEEERFIVESNLDKPSFNIPLLTGVNSEEMIFKTAGILSNQKLSNDILQKWETIFPITFHYDHLPEHEIKEINTAVYDFYFKSGLLGGNLTTLWSDGWFVNGFIDYLHQRLKSNNQDNTYVYLFSHKGSISFSEVFGGDPEKYYGTSHLDDLLYLFPIRNAFPHFYNSIPTDEDERLRKIMTSLWVNFAKTGNPTPDLSKKTDLSSWSPATKFPLDYMRIGNENGNSDKLLEMKKDLFAKNTQFWIKLREKYGLRLWKNKD